MKTAVIPELIMFKVQNRRSILPFQTLIFISSCIGRLPTSNDIKQDMSDFIPNDNPVTKSQKYFSKTFVIYLANQNNLKISY